MLVNFPKKFTFREVTHTQIGPRLCNLLSYDFQFQDFFEMLQYERIQLVDKSNSQFCQKISFGANGQFRFNLGQNCLAFYLMIGPKDLFEMF